MGIFNRKSFSYLNDGKKKEASTVARVIKNTQKYVAHQLTNKDNGTTVVFLPNKDDDGNILDERNSAIADDFTPWMIPIPGVRYAGVNRKVTMFFDIPDDNRFNKFEDHPYYTLIQAARSAKDKVIETPLGNSSIDGWYSLVWKDKNAPKVASADGTTKDNDFKAPIPSPEQLTVALGLVYAHGKENFWGPNKFAKGERPDDPLPVIIMSKDPVDRLTEALNATKNGEAAGEEDFDQLKYHPIMAKRFINFHNKETPSLFANNVKAAERKASKGGWGAASQASAGNKYGYNVAVSSFVDGSPDTPDILSKVDFQSIYANKLADWNDIVYGHSVEQTAEVVGNELGVPMSLLWYAWQRHKEWWPSDMVQKLKNPVTVIVPKDVPRKNFDPVEETKGWYGNNEDKEELDDTKPDAEPINEDTEGVIDEEVFKEAQQRLQEQMQSRNKARTALSGIGGAAAAARATASK